VLIPGLVGLYRLAWSIRNASTRRVEAVFLVGASAGLFVSAALSLGEARYRLPFDVLLLIAASMIYAKVELREPSDENWNTLSRMSVVAMTLAGVGAALVLAIAHPSIGLGMHLTQSPAALGILHARESRTPASLAKARKRSEAWDAPGNHVFRCEPSCPELIVTFDSMQHATRLSLGVDHNDRYRVFFYRRHALVGYQDTHRRDHDSTRRRDGLRCDRCRSALWRSSLRVGSPAALVINLQAAGRVDADWVVLGFDEWVKDAVHVAVPR
jgi:hypothetical protein